MTAYYNEIDPYAAQWLRNLIDAGLIARGIVDTRSIEDVRPSDLAGFLQCHFFAGLGGWSRALRLAGWADTRPIWTGSCPCQPFSVAGKGAGFADPRHLWPAFQHLIAQRKPAKVLGEQVAAASEWLGVVRSDLEALDYAVGTVPIEAASAGADHFRDRFWFVANGDDAEWRADDSTRHDHGREATERDQGASEVAERRAGPVVNHPSFGWGEGWTEAEFRSRGLTAAVASVGGGQFIECPDGKWRRLPPPRVRWLGHGIPARVAKLRALGNAIDPRPAQAFIESVM